MGESSLDYLNQGDILANYPEMIKEIIPNYQPQELAIMILNNTCDLVNENIEYISFCPVIDLNNYIIPVLDKIIKQISKTQENIKKTKKRWKDSQIEEAISKNLFNKVQSILTFTSKTKFFVIPHQSLGNKLAYADIERITTINFSKFTSITQYRVLSLNNPWKELLGFKLGYLFNRVATKDLNDDFIRNTVKSYWNTSINNGVSKIRQIIDSLSSLS